MIKGKAPSLYGIELHLRFLYISKIIALKMGEVNVGSGNYKALLTTTGVHPAPCFFF
jgi:hypothetical protein